MVAIFTILRHVDLDAALETSLYERFCCLAECELFSNMSQTLGVSAGVGLLRPISLAVTSRSETNELSHFCVS